MGPLSWYVFLLALSQGPLPDAYRAIAAKNYEAAIPHLQAALKSAPRRADIRKQLGFAYAETGQLELAIAEFERVCQANPRDFSARLQLAYFYDRAHRPQEALESFLYVAVGRDAKSARVARAELDVRRGRAQAGDAASLRALRLIVTRLEGPPAAVRALSALAAANPADAAAALELGLAYQREARRELAQAYLLSAQRLGDRDIAQQSAEHLQGRDALALLRAAAAAHPNDAGVRREMAFVLAARGDAAGAREQFQAAVHTDPGDLWSQGELFFLGDQAAWQKAQTLALGEGREAMQVGQWYLSRNPERAEAFLELAQLSADPAIAAAARQAATEARAARVARLKESGYQLHQQGRTAEAIAEFERAAALAPQDDTIALQLGFWHRETNSAKAQEWLHKAAVSANAATAAQAQRELAAIEQARIAAIKEDAYRLHREGKAGEAIARFKQALEAAPADESAAMQIGYWHVERKEFDQARLWFGQALSSKTASVAAEARRALDTVQQAELAQRRERGFQLAQQGDTRAAIREFESVLAADPHNYAAMRQVALWYSSLHEYAASRKWLESAASSPDPIEAQAARAELKGLGPLMRNYFLDASLVPLYTTRFSNFLAYSQAKIGLKAGEMRPFEPYLSVRVGRDTRSRAGTLPQIFSDNAAIFSLGVQGHPFSRFVTLYAEAGASVRLVGRTASTFGGGRPDYRGGLLYARSWGAGLADSGGGPLARFRDVYFDLSYYRRFGDNVIGYLQFREGWRLASAVSPLRVQLFGGFNLAKDSKGDYYNNVVEFGPGIRFGWKGLPGVSFTSQYVRGVYLGPGRRTRSDRGANFHDLRVFVTLGVYR
jgi:tetratricopeptide (TPR) repeat protein